MTSPFYGNRYIPVTGRYKTTNPRTSAKNFIVTEKLSLKDSRLLTRIVSGTIDARSGFVHPVRNGMLRALFTMCSRLNKIIDWERRAQAANYSVKALAILCGVSRQHLGRFFRETRGVAVHEWINEHRLRMALVFLFQGRSVKETAHLLAYTQVSNFSRDFRLFYGVPPGEFHLLSHPMSSFGLHNVPS
jgi:AraC-like DNA-binding protein